MSAELIAHEACRALFADEQKRNDEVEAELAIECYENVFTKAELEWTKTASAGWLSEDKCLRFNVNGWDVRLSVPKAVPVPAKFRNGCMSLGVVGGELAVRVRDFVLKRDGDRDKRAKARRDLEDTILSAGTFKRLADMWPEGRPYYESYLLTKPPGTALSTPFTALNEVLGLKKEEKPLGDKDK
jgi:hypothetical protein